MKELQESENRILKDKIQALEKELRELREFYKLWNKGAFKNEKEMKRFYELYQLLNPENK